MTQTLFAQPTAGMPGIVSDNSDYTMGMQFSLSQSASLTGIWFYSPPGAVSLPDACVIYQVTGTGTGSQVSGTLVNSPTWSGLAGSGWIKCSYNGSVTLSAGTNYKVCIHHGFSSNFYGATAHYWDTGAGATGQTSGIITAPGNAGADGGQNSFISPSAATAYPNTSFNATNYWIDVELSTAVTQSGSASLSASASLTAAAKLTEIASAHLSASPALTAAAVVTRPGVAHLAASPALTALARTTEVASSHLSAAPALTAPGRVSKVGVAHLSTSPVLTASATAFGGASAHLSTSPGLTAVAGLSRAGSAHLSAGATLTAAPGASRPGSAHMAAGAAIAAAATVISSVRGQAPLAAAPALTAMSLVAVTPASLWNIYIAAHETASKAWFSYRMMRQAGGTDGTAGFLFGAAYEAQNASDLAYESWRAAEAQAVPGARG